MSMDNDALSNLENAKNAREVLARKTLARKRLFYVLIALDILVAILLIVAILDLFIY